MAISSTDASGIVVRGPQARGPSKGDRAPRARGRRRWAFLAVGLAVLAGGAAGVWSLRNGGRRGGDPAPAAIAAAAPPAPDCQPAEARVAEVEAKLAAATKTIDELRARDRALAAQAAAATADRDKLAGVVGAQGEVSQRGDEITLELVDKVLFRVGEAELTPRGAEVLAQVGAALNDVPDKQIWVQGHTDDTPMRGSRGAPPRFASNWELASARALTVVHYLQDHAKVDPRRLAAVAFGQYRPAARQKAKHRRIEIVLYPTHQLAR